MRDQLAQHYTVHAHGTVHARETEHGDALEIIAPTSNDTHPPHPADIQARRAGDTQLARHSRGAVLTRSSNVCVGALVVFGPINYCRTDSQGIGSLVSCSRNTGSR